MAYLKFWGVRGSIPTPGPDTTRYGGNTPCVELRCSEDVFFILDAGSGLRALGQHLLKLGKPVKASIFISHMHWDHIQGVPFFTPAYIPGNKFSFYSVMDGEKNIGDVLSDQMNPVNFPVDINEMNAEFDFNVLYEGKYEIEGIKIETFYLNHPGNALGYKFFVNGKSIVYVSDNEPYAVRPELKSETDNPDELLFLEDNNKRLIKWIAGADYLIHDAQYTPEEYKTKYQWGHSPYDYTVKVALQSKTKNLILYHHDPVHNDDFIDSMVDASKKLSWQSGGDMNILAAKEGLEISLD